MIYSAKFIAFILMLLIVYYALPQKYKWTVLLAGSYIFYAVKGRLFIVFILFSTVLSFFVAQKIETLGKTKNEAGEKLSKEEKQKNKQKKKWLVAFIVVVLGAMLSVFKFQPLIDRFSLVLPIGMSYYTFQIIGYVVDVYRKEYEAEKNIFKYALFVGYFPGMIQGPINRFGKMKEQFFAEHRFSLVQIRNGAWIFLWGLFKKLVIADRACVFVNAVMNENYAEFSGSMLLMSVIMFVFQMYADFSGGIDMVEGISEMFGISMYQNFNQPFFSRDIGEFWRRWHISLGNWIRDYVFYPLAFSKTYREISAKIAKYNTHLAETIPAMGVSVITFTIIGLWHGINLTYLIYGLWYGFAVGLSKVFAPVFTKVNQILEVNTECMSHRAFQRLRTMLIVLIGESFCIIPTTGAFLGVVKAIFTRFDYSDLFFAMFEQGLTHVDFFVLFIALIIWVVVSLLKENGHSLRQEIGMQNIWFRCMLTFGVIFVIAIFGTYGPGFDASAFIYGGI